jgi:glycosyltransferase involved in cell wall biosynthesis
MTKIRTDLMVIEAMAAAVPVVASVHDTFVQLEHDKATALLPRPRGTGPLAEYVCWVPRNGDRNRELNAAARRCYEAQFTPATGLANLVPGYEAAVAGRSCELG